MRALRRFSSGWAPGRARRSDEERLKSEIEEHLALQTAENLRAGLSPAEARRQALLKFGAVEAMKEDLSGPERTAVRGITMCKIRAMRCAACENPRRSPSRLS